MRCSSLSCPSLTIPQIKATLQKPLTKAALFVLAFLLAASAGIAYLASLGTPAITALSLASVGSIVLLSMILLGFAKSRQEIETALKEEISKLTIEELIQQVIPLVDTHRNILIAEDLKLRIDNFVKAHLQTKGPQEIAKALQPFFSAADTPIKAEFLANLIYLNTDYTLLFSGYILDNLEWPDESIKRKVIENWGEEITKNYLTIKKEAIPHGNPQHPEYYSVKSLYFNTQKMFEGKTDNLYTTPIPDFLAQAIYSSILKIANDVIEDLEKLPWWSSAQQKGLPLGIKIILWQSADRPLSPTRIAPLLPYLKSTPALVGLDLSPLGRSDPWQNYLGSTDGFGDDTAEALLAIFSTNPFLKSVKVSTSGMSSAGEKEFLEQWRKLWNASDMDPPNAGYIVAHARSQT